MEVVSCKVSQSHYCIWNDEGCVHIEDVEACRILSVSENHLQWILTALSKLLRGPADGYFQNFGEMNGGRLKISKFKAKIGWVLSCDYWPYSGGSLQFKSVHRRKQQGWMSFCNMLNKFVAKEDCGKSPLSRKKTGC